MEVKQFPMFVAIAAYNKRMEDELDMLPGDRIKVINDDSLYHDGWYLGTNLRTNEQGLYPLNFTQEISSQPTQNDTNNNMNSRNVSNQIRSQTTNNDNHMFRTTSHQSNYNDMSSLYTNNNNMSYVQSHEVQQPKQQVPHKPAPPPPASQHRPPPQQDNYQFQDNVSISNNMNNNFASNNIANSRNPSVQEYGQSHPQQQYQQQQQQPKMPTTRPSRKASNVSYFDLHSVTEAIDMADNYQDNNIPLPDVQNVLHWSPEEVTQYFLAKGFDDKTSNTFTKHQISGNILIELELPLLKELDMDSFGIRYQVYKEITNINKQLPQNQQRQQQESLSAPAMVGSYSNSSQQDINVQKRGNRIPNPIDTSRIPSDMIQDETLFESPRKAPKPPQYPSPVQNLQSPQSPVGRISSKNVNSPMRGRVASPSTIYEDASINFDDSQTFNDANKMSRSNTVRSQRNPSGLSNNRPASMYNVSNSRTSSVYNNVGMDDNRSMRNVSGNSTYSPQMRHSLQFNSPKTMNNNNFAQFQNGGQQFGRQQQPENTQRRSHNHRKTNSVIVTGQPKEDNAPVVARSKSTKNSNRFSRIFSFGSSPNINASKRTPNGSKNVTRTPTGNSFNGSSPRPNVSSMRTSSATLPVTSPHQTISRSGSGQYGTKQMKSLPVRSSKQMARLPMDGPRFVELDDAINQSDMHGWMSMKKGDNGSWKTGYFILQNSRLSWYSSKDDTKEEGVHDITNHRVEKMDQGQRMTKWMAAARGKGDHCFKLYIDNILYYCAVDTKEDLKGWLRILLKSSISLDHTSPVMSTYSTTVLSLDTAKQMLQVARNETMMQMDDGQMMNNSYSTPNMQRQNSMNYQNSPVNNNQQHGNMFPNQTGGVMGWTDDPNANQGRSASITSSTYTKSFM